MLTPKRIQALRRLISLRVPTGYLELLPGDHHIYRATDTGAQYVSVTTRLQVIHNPQFINWRMNRALDYIYDHHESQKDKEALFREAKAYPNTIFEQAGTRGTTVHAIIDRYLKARIDGTHIPIITDFLDGTHGEKQEDFAVWAAVRSYVAWEEKSFFIPLASELRVWSHRHKLAGTLDAVGTIGNEIVLLDFKTSNNFRDDYWLQVSCYWRMFRELTKFTPKRCIILKLNKDYADGREEEVIDPKARFKDYLVASRLYDVMHDLRELRKPKKKLL